MSEATTRTKRALRRIPFVDSGPEASRQEPQGSRFRKPRPRPKPPGPRLPLVDTTTILLSSLFVLPASTQVGIEDVAWQLVFVAAAISALAFGGAYKPHFALHFLDDLRLIFGATAVAAMALTFARELLTADGYATTQAIRAWLFGAIYISAGRGGTELAMNWYRQRAMIGGATLIVGAGKVGNLVAKRLIATPGFGLRPVAFLDDNPLAGAGDTDLPVFRLSNVTVNPDEAPTDSGELVKNIEQLVEEFAIEHVVVAFSLNSHGQELEMMRTCEELGVSVSLIPRLFERVPDRTQVERLGGIPLITVYPSHPRGWQFGIKYVFDRFFALLGLILLSPLLLVIAVAVAISLGRPILFHQKRLGLDGQTFTMLKFRTMHPPTAGSAEAPSVGSADQEAPGGVEGVDRRSRLGRFLRATSLDELPQFLNVLRGDMSLVGPRPERVAYASVFEQEIYRYAERHRVKSGITGWAQIHRLRGKTSIDDRVEWDNYYIENWSFWLDLKILLGTPLAMLRDRGE